MVFLCIGAAKAGTSWVYDHLARHPGCHLRGIKELHYFTALEAGHLDRELEKHRGYQEGALKRLARGTAGPGLAGRVEDRADWMDVLARGQEDVPAYLDYLKKGARGDQVIGDVTPAYALLPEARLKQIGTMARDVRILFLMRDPVERLWSHVRMIAARRDPGGRATAQRCGRLLQKVFSGEESQIVKRSDYAGTLKRLKSALPEGRVLIEVFEEMIAGEGFARILRFLGLAPMDADPVPVHRGQPVEMTRDQRAAARAWLAPQYDAAREALGRCPAAWMREGVDDGR